MKLPWPATPAAWCLTLGAAGALLLAGASVHVNLERGCAVRDTPYLPLCPQDSPESPVYLNQLRSRIAANPGDSAAYVRLVMYDTSPGSAQRLATAVQLAPSDPTVMMMQASAALAQEDWAAAVGPLVRLSEHGTHSQAARTLARLIGIGQGQLLAAHLTPGSRWLAQVLAQLAQAQVPVAAATPLIAQAIRAGALDTALVPPYLQQLKAAAQWTDAYGVWLALHPGPTPLLYNGGFDQRPTSHGFDWEVAEQHAGARAGALINRPLRDKRGAVLDIRFTGRRFPVPLVRQYLFLGEGPYRIRGEYQASRLQTEQGLAWAVRCTASAVPAGRSGALGDTGGAWQPFVIEVVVPKGCGQVVSLQLESHAPFEAETGMHGHVAFDAFSLEQMRD